MKSNAVIFFLIIVIAGLGVYGISLMAGMSTDQFDQKHIKPYESGSQTNLPIGSVTVDGHENSPVQNWFEWKTEEDDSDNRITKKLPTAKDRQAGQELYQTYCQVCHGTGFKKNQQGLATSKMNDVGMVAADLPSLTPFRNDHFLYLKIENGGTVMPRLGHVVTSDIRWQIVAYLRSVEMVRQEKR